MFLQGIAVMDDRRLEIALAIFARAWDLARAFALIALAAPFYGVGWLLAASVALVTYGAKAGWRAVRTLSEDS